jgi:hypothetical protein
VDRSREFADEVLPWRITYESEAAQYTRFNSLITGTTDLKTVAPSGLVDTSGALSPGLCEPSPMRKSAFHMTRNALSKCTESHPDSR